MMSCTTVRNLVPVAALPPPSRLATGASLMARRCSAAVAVRAGRNYDSFPEPEPSSSSRSIRDEFLRQENSLVQRTKDQITDYCTTLEGDECRSCWDAYFELNKLEQELPKDEITRMVKDSEGDVRCLIDSIHHRSNQRKKMAEKARDTSHQAPRGKQRNQGLSLCLTVCPKRRKSLPKKRKP